MRWFDVGLPILAIFSDILSHIFCVWCALAGNLCTPWDLLDEHLNSNMRQLVNSIHFDTACARKSKKKRLFIFSFCFLYFGNKTVAEHTTLANRRNEIHKLQCVRTFSYLITTFVFFTHFSVAHTLSHSERAKKESEKLNIDCVHVNFFAFPFATVISHFLSDSFSF